MSTRSLQVILLFILLYNIRTEDEFCDATDTIKCSTINKIYRYILYDVNPPEGFNLRRDVYMRLAVFLNNLNKSQNNFKLVLPPWTDLYHWRSNNGNNMHLPWSHFFDLKSLQNFVPVIEMYQFFDEIGRNYKQTVIDEVYILQNFEDMFTSGNFEDKFAIEPCLQSEQLNFFEYNNLTSSNIKCLSFHGLASQLVKLIENSNSRSFMFHHAEIVLHDRYGDKIYWQARRSMRFNTKLREIANKFRGKYLNSTDDIDKTIIPVDWRDEKPHRTAKGGPYLCVHLRRQDFLRGRPNEIPNLEHAAKQIDNILLVNNLTKVFIATDAPIKEYNELKSKLSIKKYEIFKYNPSKETISKYKDGGIAIIEQIICSHAFYFIGTHESTFSFRIQEEREILGFPTKRTFNRLCGSNKKCSKASMWKIVY